MGEVAVSIASIISAFASGLDVFGKIRERRQKKKNVKRKSEDDEMLAESLKRGSVSVRREYEARWRVAGDGFARGDAVAQSHLAEILLKLNTGIANIIAAFIRHGQRKPTEPFAFDARSVMALSDASQAETLHALAQLHTRLSSRQNSRPRALHRQDARRDPRQHTRENAGQDARRDPQHPPTQLKPTRKRRAEIARVPIKSSSSTHLVVIRPRPRPRPRRSSSSSSTTPPSTAGPHTSAPAPSASPLPLAAPRRHTHPQHLSRPPHAQPLASHHPPTPSHPPTAEPYSAPARRRAVKSTPSSYTFLSTSTRIGEIPMARWDVPWDYDAAARLNEAAQAQAYAGEGLVEEGEARKKRGWRWWGRKRVGEEGCGGGKGFGG